MTKPFKVTKDLHASSGQRLANLFIDRLLFYGLFFAIAAILYAYGEITGNSKIEVFLVNLEGIDRITDMLVTGATFAFFYTVFEYKTQRTIGKYISKTKVVLENGEKPDLNTIIIRSLCRIIPFDALSFLGSSIRGWHDTMSKTYVVDAARFDAKKSNHHDFQFLGQEEEKRIRF